MSYIDTVRAFVIENFLFGDDKQLKEDTSFLGRSIIDSTGVLELVSFIEQTYNVIIEDDELIPENLDSLSKIDMFLRAKLDGKSE
jgi:acyl carrier protein